MSYFSKLLLLIFACIVLLFAVGVAIRISEDREDAKCIKVSSAEQYWHYDCPNGRKFYVQKSDAEIEEYLR